MIEVEFELVLQLNVELDDLMDSSLREMMADQLHDAEVVNYRVLGAED